MSIISAVGSGLGGAGDSGGALGGGVVYSHTIDKSVRMSDAGNTTLQWQAGTPSSTSVWTMSVWMKKYNPTAGQAVNEFFSAGSSGSAYSFLAFNADQHLASANEQSGTKNKLWYNRAFRDVSGWFHLVLRSDLGQSVQDDRLKVYINGEFLSSTSDGLTMTAWSYINADGITQNWGGKSGIANGNPGCDFYLADINFCDGQSYSPNEFGETVDGVWVPKNPSVTYGNNGYRLEFKQTGTGGASSSTIGADTSGNNNHFTDAGITTRDMMPDTPTNNYATAHPFAANKSSPWTYTQGNLDIASASNNKSVRGTMLMQSGKWYWESRRNNANNSDAQKSLAVGIGKPATDIETTPYQTGTGDSLTYYSYGGTKRNGSSNTSYGDAWDAAGDIIGVAFDADNGAIWFSKNGTWQASATASEIAAGTTTNAAFTGLTDSDGYVCLWWRTGGTNSTSFDLNFGQNPSFNNQLTGGDIGTESGDGGALFKYPPPTGFKALCTTNMPDPAYGPGLDEQSNDHFDTILYTGIGKTLAVGTGGMRRPLDTISIAQSLRFNDSSLHRDISSSGNTQTWTWSAWVKRSSLGGSNGQYLFSDGKSSSLSSLNFDSNDKLYIQLRDTTGSTSKYKLTTQTFQNVATWFHIVWRVDTTQSTAADRSRIYINGTQITDFDTDQNVDQNDNTTINASGNDHLLGAYNTSSTSRHFDGYMAEINFADGNSYGPDTFGQVGANGDWIPKTVTGVTYGTNGFRLDFADGSALGDDESGNGNDFDVTDNVSSTDKISDSPTQNFATLDSTRPSGTTLTMTEGALKAERTSSSFAQAYSNVVITKGKFYAEVLMDTGNCDPGVIVGDTIPGSNRYIGQDTYTYGYYRDGRKINNGSYTSYGGTYSVAADGSGDVVGILINADDGEISFSVNGTVQNSGVPAFTGLTGPYRFAVDSESNAFVLINFGQDDTFNGLKTSGSAAAADGNGNGKFYDTPPSGYLALMDDNLPRKSDVINPDFVWIKSRENTRHHMFYDSVRGVHEAVRSSTAAASVTNIETLQSFDSQGFTVGSDSDVNTSQEDFVAWVWKAGGSTNTFNVDGTGYASASDASLSGGDITPTAASVNRTNGFSIIGYTGNGSSSSSGQTIKHGLSKPPEFMLIKDRDSNSNNNQFQASSSIIGDDYAYLSTTAQFTGAALMKPNSGDNTLVNIGIAATSGARNTTNENGDNFIMYCFHTVPGYSKVGRYEGNSEASNGTFVFTGFRPAFVMGKAADQTGRWWMYDDKRTPYNDDDIENGRRLNANMNASESTSDSSNMVLFFSNGFKVNTTNAEWNGSSKTYFYLAFAQAPFKFSNAR